MRPSDRFPANGRTNPPDIDADKDGTPVQSVCLKQHVQAQRKRAELGTVLWLKLHVSRFTRQINRRSFFDKARRTELVPEFRL
jgi:hypothetical protein